LHGQAADGGARDDDPAARADLRAHRARCPWPGRVVPATAASRRPQKIAGWTRSPKPTASRGQRRFPVFATCPVVILANGQTIADQGEKNSRWGQAEFLVN